MGATATIETGAVVECPAGTWKFTGSPHTLFLRIDRVRDDLSCYYDDEIWVEGQQLAHDGTPMGPMQALVAVAHLKVLKPGG
jgi:hypothetical protein